jgi:hypothetical protein
MLPPCDACPVPQQVPEITQGFPHGATTPTGAVMLQEFGVHFPLIVRITLRYAVNVGLPSSSTARMTCATPGTRGVTLRRGVVFPLSVTRAGG